MSGAISNDADVTTTALASSNDADYTYDFELR